MPPAIFIGAAAGAIDGFEVFHFPLPASTKPGDTAIMVIVGFEDTLVVPDSFDDLTYVDYLDALAIGGDQARVAVARRVIRETDPPVLLVHVGSPGSTTLSCVLVYRDLADVATISASGSEIAASTNFVCPSRTLARYSDLYLGIVAIRSAGVAVTPPAGTTERYEDTTGGHTLEAFELRAEAPGATGTKTATTAAAQTGTANSMALAVNGIRGSNKSIKISPAGCIGLPTEGV